jgi:hypothetical protein
VLAADRNVTVRRLDCNGIFAAGYRSAEEIYILVKEPTVRAALTSGDQAPLLRLLMKYKREAQSSSSAWERVCRGETGRTYRRRDYDMRRRHNAIDTERVADNAWITWLRSNG